MNCMGALVSESEIEGFSAEAAECWRDEDERAQEANKAKRGTRIGNDEDRNIAVVPETLSRSAGKRE